MSKFLQLRAEQLAIYLRNLIEQGKLCDPLPPTRAWSERLGVGRDSLLQALGRLEREGLLRVRHNGTTLSPALRPLGKVAQGRICTVRLICLHAITWTVHYDVHLITRLFELFSRDEIHFTIEQCSPAGMRSLARSEENPDELLLLYSVPATYHRMFLRGRRSSLVIGLPPRAGGLPSISVDQEGALRHATLSLLRRGFSSLYCVSIRCASPGSSRMTAVFEETCREWGHQPIRPQTVLLAPDLAALLSDAERFAMRLTPRCGVLVMAPVPLTLIQSILLLRGIKVPSEVELIAMYHPPISLFVHPAPIHYTFQSATLAKAILRIALHYFGTGQMPRIRNLIPIKVVRRPASLLV